MSTAGKGGPARPSTRSAAREHDDLAREPLSARFFAREATEVAPDLLGCVLVHGPVAVRLTEVEAYLGVGEDPGSHSYTGRTARNASMFGPPGRAYVYFTYGMHWMVNLVCGSEGESRGILLRAGEVVAGHDVVAERRAGIAEREWTRGPARLARALAIDGSYDGLAVTPDAARPSDAVDTDLAEAEVAAADVGPAMLVLPPAAPVTPDLVRQGGRVGISGPGGDAEAYPWRWWLAGERSVSSYRPGKFATRRGR